MTVYEPSIVNVNIWRYKNIHNNCFITCP